MSALKEPGEKTRQPLAESDEHLIERWRRQLPDGANDRGMAYFFAAASNEMAEALDANPALADRVEEEFHRGERVKFERKGDAVVMSIGSVVIACFNRAVLFEGGPKEETR